jgi:hypothetical protein
MVPYACYRCEDSRSTGLQFKTADAANASVIPDSGRKEYEK